MPTYLAILLVTIVLLALAIAGMAIRMFVFKDGEFKKKCASIDMEDGEHIGCHHCTAERHEDCVYYELHHGKNKKSEILKNSQHEDKIL